MSKRTMKLILPERTFPGYFTRISSATMVTDFPNPWRGTIQSAKFGTQHVMAIQGDLVGYVPMGCDYTFIPLDRNSWVEFL